MEVQISRTDSLASASHDYPAVRSERWRTPATVFTACCTAVILCSSQTEAAEELSDKIEESDNSALTIDTGPIWENAYESLVIKLRALNLGSKAIHDSTTLEPILWDARALTSSAPIRLQTPDRDPFSGVSDDFLFDALIVQAERVSYRAFSEQPPETITFHKALLVSLAQELCNRFPEKEPDTSPEYHVDSGIIDGFYFAISDYLKAENQQAKFRALQEAELYLSMFPVDESCSAPEQTAEEAFDEICRLVGSNPFHHPHKPSNATIITRMVKNWASKFLALPGQPSLLSFSRD